MMPEENTRAYRRPPIFGCPCGNTHRLTPAAAAMVVTAFLRGELQHVTSRGVEVHGCILQALYMPELQQLYRGSTVDAE